ncbi:hypothetical protein Pla175_07640 [Pirellulimonas nuda]|uniref:Uncharacterized protein n=1 Tax=Pirellulimonas nuda TaxID=2528009 RepID=A0A518D7E6_9BACT|nr:hypothetical protein [Pirellulimonas nuda]QDU87404.1 hypothetical protein Pla175_07640 [Pirellulimonas nuda]
MKTIEVSDATYSAIAAHFGDVGGFLDRAAQYARSKGDEQPRFDADSLLGDFRRIEGMFGAASLQEVLGDRRLGRE